MVALVHNSFAFTLCAEVSVNEINAIFCRPLFPALSTIFCVDKSAFRHLRQIPDNPKVSSIQARLGISPRLRLVRTHASIFTNGLERQ